MTLDHAKRTALHFATMLTAPRSWGSPHRASSFDRLFMSAAGVMLDEAAAKKKIVELVDHLANSSSFRTGSLGKELIAAASEYRRELSETATSTEKESA